MSLYRRAARRDAAEPALLQYAQQLGWRVCRVSVKDGPDAFLARADITVAVEVKTGKRKLRPGQQAWFDMWPGEKAVLRTVEDVLQLGRFLDERDALVRDVEYWRRTAREWEANEQEEHARADQAEARVVRLEALLDSAEDLILYIAASAGNEIAAAIRADVEAALAAEEPPHAE